MGGGGGGGGAEAEWGVLIMLLFNETLSFSLAKRKLNSVLKLPYVVFALVAQYKSAFIYV